MLTLWTSTVGLNVYACLDGLPCAVLAAGSGGPKLGFSPRSYRGSGGKEGRPLIRCSTPSSSSCVLGRHTEPQITPKGGTITANDSLLIPTLHHRCTDAINLLQSSLQATCLNTPDRPTRLFVCFQVRTVFRLLLSGMLPLTSRPIFQPDVRRALFTILLKITGHCHVVLLRV